MKQMQPGKPDVRISGDTGDSGDTLSAPYARETEAEETQNGAGGQECHRSHQSHRKPGRMGPPPVRMYASGARPDRPVYRPGHEPLPFTDDPHLAACDVMILTFAARRHAEHAAELGPIGADIADLIRKDLASIASVIDRSDEPATPSTATPPTPAERPAHGRPCSSQPAVAPTPAPTLFDATRPPRGRDVAECEPPHAPTRNDTPADSALPAKPTEDPAAGTVAVCD